MIPTSIQKESGRIVVFGHSLWSAISCRRNVDVERSTSRLLFIEIVITRCKLSTNCSCTPLQIEWRDIMVQRFRDDVFPGLGFSQRVPSSDIRVAGDASRDRPSINCYTHTHTHTHTHTVWLAFNRAATRVYTVAALIRYGARCSVR